MKKQPRIHAPPSHRSIYFPYKNAPPIKIEPKKVFEKKVILRKAKQDGF